MSADIKKIIEEAVASSQKTVAIKETNDNAMEPKDKEKDEKKPESPEFPEGKQDTPADYDTYMQASKEKSDVFERLTPIQLTALLESILRNKTNFDRLYTALAAEGFVALNESADYDVKRAQISEMIRDGQLSKHMLQTLVESDQIRIEATHPELVNPQDRKIRADILRKDINRPYTKTHQLAQTPPEDPNYLGTITPEDLEQQNKDFAMYGNEPSDPRKQRKRLAAMANQPTSVDQVGDEEGTLPVDEPETNPEDVAMDTQMDDSMLSQLGSGTDPLMQVGTEEDQVMRQMSKNKADLADFAKEAGFTKPDGSGDLNAFSSFLAKNPDRLSPEQQDWANFFSQVMAQQKELTDKYHMLQSKKERSVELQGAPKDLEPVEVDEAKRMQLRKGTGASELQLRAGSQGKIFESRLRKLEPYKKVAVLEFLENDPRMIDDQDYADMATLTGICEADLIAMRIEYEDGVLNEMNYPVFGGQDVRGQNSKNESKALKRDMAGAEKSQETTEEKVRDFKIKKFNIGDVKDKVEQNGATDQNRGMHTQIDVLNQESNDKKKGDYKQQADGVFGKRDPKAVKTDANVGDGKAGEGKVTTAGSDLLDKGAAQPDYYATTPNETEDPETDKTRPINKMDATSQPIKVKHVNEDVDRMKALFGYDTNRYAHPRTVVNENAAFDKQLKVMRELHESVDTAGLPNAEQLNEMKIIDFDGKKARTDGFTVFEEGTGKKLGECGAVGEARGLELPHNADQSKTLKTGTDARKKGYDVKQLDEGTDTGKVCSECRHKIWEVKGTKKCMCDKSPVEESDDPLQKNIDRQRKLAGIKTEAKHQQLKHTKGHQLQTGTKEEIVDEAKNLQLKHTKGLQLKTGTKTEEK